MSERNIKSGRRGGPMGQGSIGGRFEKPKDFKGTFSKLLEYLRPYRLRLITVVMFAIGSTIFTIRAPKILGKATTKIFEGLISKVSGAKGGGIDFQYILNIILLLIGLYILSALFAFIQGFIVTGVAQKVSYNLRKDISQKVNRLPLKYFDLVSHGDVLSRVTNDVDTVSQSLNQSMSQIITSTTTLIGVLIMMFSISWQMTISAILILPISMILVMTVVKKSQKYFKEQQSSLGKVNGHIEEVYGGHNIMKAFNAEEEVIGKFSRINGELYKSAWKAQFISGMMMPIMNFIGNIGYVVVSVLGGWYAIRKKIEVGDILSFIQYIRNFTQPITQVAQISNVLQSTVAAAERVFEFLEEEEETKESEVPIKLKEVEGRVRFENIKFGYNEDKIIINNFSSDIKPGQKVAIVGPTGAGKTTIIKLLMRFYDLNEGRILIDGYDINDFTRKDLRDNFGMVLQDTWLFSGTIMENIRYGRLDATDEEVIHASKSAHSHRFIQTLPEGYNMVINEEANNISQGQKQLLTIARAILSDPKILILDEATSSVDTRTEILIQRAMKNLMKGRTAFIIAHRLSTIRDADLILVMKDGDIIEKGNHEELLRNNGFYAELYNSQFAA
ncbi:ATP-binding cassette subfamily B protein [Tissierella praeacuta]|uniref:ABC transporter ATP-binding protein n=1 Tax=Tissierella praeacuta TaxID=43131 RepID=UPI001042E86B|nr:ABC transporter ATP-binding protein [Tissierella praeacuta]TCU68138.1 ATP-binding cassette subfamily B protein [Tissierella praeacuta]